MSTPADLPDNSISALPELFCYIISLVDDKILIEDFEVLPTLEFSHRSGKDLIKYRRYKTQQTTPELF